jgi:Na+/glutamate symporter
LNRGERKFFPSVGGKVLLDTPLSVFIFLYQTLFAHSFFFFLSFHGCGEIYDFAAVEIQRGVK